MLRKKNRLMRAGRVEEAGALAKLIGRDMQLRCKSQLDMIDGKTDAKSMWAAVRQMTGPKPDVASVDGVNAETLNDHYTAIATDNNYTAPTRKQSTTTTQTAFVSDWQVFRALDSLRPTAMGLDGLPAWSLRVATTVFCRPIATLFNLSLVTSTVPLQWKEASICPIPKTTSPKLVADFRPISITPILTRILSLIHISEPTRPY